VKDRIPIRVPDGPQRVVEQDTAQHTWPTTALGLKGLKTMQVVAVPNPEWRHAGSVADTTLPQCPDSMARVAGGATCARRCLNAASVSG
jgi:hypothetical protein